MPDVLTMETLQEVIQKVKLLQPKMAPLVCDKCGEEFYEFLVPLDQPEDAARVRELNHCPSGGEHQLKR
jgi:hypothetical protein